MKTILINKTLTTIALISTIQCGYGTGTVHAPMRVPIVLDSELILSSGTFTAKGMTITDNASLEISDGKFINSGGMKVEGSLTLSGGTFINSGDMNVGGSLTLSGGTFINSDDMNVEGSLTLSGGKFNNSGTFANTDSTCVNGNSELILSSGTFTTRGMTITDNASLEISGGTSGGTFNNSGDMEVKGSLTLSGGKFTNSAQMKVYGSMTLSGNGSFIMDSRSKLSVLTTGKFCVSDKNTHDVTLNGTIAIESTSASVDVSKMNILSSNFEKPGYIDMSPLRSYSINATTPSTLPETVFTCKQLQQLPNIILPFNCQFSNVDLREAAKVYYTVLRFVNSAKIDNYIIKVGDIPSQVSQDDIAVSYGDYANNSSLGVTLPNDANKLYPDNQNVATLYLSYLVNKKDENDKLEYNKSDYKLLTDNLDNAAQTISAETSYNFGFIGTKAISITGSGKAVFNGDNSEYKVAPTISVPEVEFGANNSLFQFTNTYGHGTFSAANGTDKIENTIPAGAEVTFTSGFTLGKGHTLIVRGTLIG